MGAPVIQPEIEPLPERKFEPIVFKNEGLLSSTYKIETGHNFFHSSPRSIYGIKQRLNHGRFQFTSSIETVLKLSVFAIVLAFALV